MIVGKPGCGKSHLIREFLINKDLYNKKFNLVLFITPSRFEDGNIILDDKNHRDSVDVDWIHSTLQRYKEYVEKSGKDTTEKTFLRFLTMLYQN